MKKLSVIAFAIACGAANANIRGEGEHRFGPETAENVACAIAEEKAKENAIANFVGELIEHQTNEVCRDTQCTTHRTYFSEVSGEIRRIIRKQSFVAPENKASVCIVELDADVVKIENSIDLRVKGKNQLLNGERFGLQMVSNRIGNLAIFNMTDDKYRLIYTVRIDKPNSELTFPNGGKFQAILPNSKYQSNELLVFLFTENNLTYDDFYSKMEFERLVKDLPFKNRKLISHQINITR
jgi:hypothetical protein